MQKTHITVILDRSGSMESTKDATIKGFNSWLKEATIVARPSYNDAYTVDNIIETMFKNVPLDRINKMTPALFVPRAQTALNDAIIYAIKQAEEVMPPESSWIKVADWLKPLQLVVIITDGGESCSSHNTQQVNSAIDAKRAQGWEFVFIGANQDSFVTGGGYGIARGSIMNYQATPKGTQDAWATLNTSTVAYRGSAGATAGNFFAPEAGTSGS